MASRSGSKTHAKHDKRDKVKHSAGGRTSKKGGGGGKGTWGTETDDIKYANERLTVSPGDPNYDSEEDPENVRLSTVSIDQATGQQFRNYVERLGEYKSNVQKLATEFLHDTHNLDDFISAVKPLLNRPRDLPQVPKILLSKSFDYGDNDQQLVSRLLKRMVEENLLTVKNITDGVNLVIGRLHDLMLDVPDVVKYVDGFVKRGAADGFWDAAQAQAYFDILGTSKDSGKAKKRVQELLRQYFISEDVDELLAGIVELDDPAFHKNVVKYAISMALDAHRRECLLVSRFLARTHDDETNTPQLKHSQVRDGFILLLDQVEDLSEDVPKVDELLAKFIARAVQDEAIAPSFVNKHPYQEGDIAYPVLQQAKQILGQKHAGERIAHIWGPDQHSVHDLQQAVHALALEFFSSGNQDAAHKAVIVLDADHFHHEIVRQLFRMCVDKYKKEVSNIADLLSLLVKEGVIAETEITKGLTRIENEISELEQEHPKTDVKALLKELRDQLKL